MILLSLLLFVVLVNAAHIGRDIHNDFDWYQAELDCSNLGMQLLTLDTQAKIDFWSVWMEDNP
ncbi:hypothetical protein B566_EDAN010907, partial [Ephemera danica]